MKAYVIYSEWDIGHEGKFYLSKENAWKQAEILFNSQEFDDGYTFQDAKDENLISIGEVEYE